LSEIIGKDGVSQMETYFGDVLNWSALNLMNINITKTKEMIVGANVNPPPQLIFSDKIIEREFPYSTKAKRCNSQRYGPFLRNGD